MWKEKTFIFPFGFLKKRVHLKTFLFPFSFLMAVQAADCRLMTDDFLNLSFSF